MIPRYRYLVLFLLLGLCAGTARADPMEAAIEAYESGDYETALEILRPLAEQGHPDAQFRLGTMFDNGLGLPKDAVKAEYWYNKACPLPEFGTDR